jgi:clan AA aspartic protease (TIGR02281 family)
MESDREMFMPNQYPLRPWIKFSCALGVLVFLILASPSHSAIYKWKDNKGKTHFTDNLSKIPPQYRKKGELKNMKGDTVESSDFAKLSLSKKNRRTHVIKARMGPGDHYVVEVIINGSITANLMVDTGATMVVLSDRIGKRLGVHPNSDLPKIGMNTAGGKVEAPLFVLNSLKIGSAEVLNVETTTNPYMGDMDGLLGMSFLGEFKMEMDRQSGKLILKPLGAPEDELWEGKNHTWWKKKYVTYADNLRGLYRSARHVRGNKQKLKQIEQLIAHYEKLHKGLEIRANRANLPNIFRSYP